VIHVEKKRKMSSPVMEPPEMTPEEREMFEFSKLRPSEQNAVIESIGAQNRDKRMHVATLVLLLQLDCIVIVTRKVTPVGTPGTEEGARSAGEALRIAGAR
jgi:hypothetical protein